MGSNCSSWVPEIMWGMEASVGENERCFFSLFSLIRNDDVLRPAARIDRPVLRGPFFSCHHCAGGKQEEDKCGVYEKVNRLCLHR